VIIDNRGSGTPSSRHSQSSKIEWRCGTLSLALCGLRRFHSLKIENGHSSPLEVKSGREGGFVEEFFTTTELTFTLLVAFPLFYILNSI